MFRRRRTIEKFGETMVRYGLATVVGTIGALKFTDYEAHNIEPLVANSPLTSWLRRSIGMKGASRLIGAVELATAGLLAFAPRRSTASAVGSALAIAMFGTTLSFLVSTPAARGKSTRGMPILTDVGQFLLKDAVLLGASVLTLGESMDRPLLHR